MAEQITVILMRLFQSYRITFKQGIDHQAVIHSVERLPSPRYFIRTPYNGGLASQTRHDYCPQSSMIRGVMSPGLVGRW
ncbi:hypothetical protein EC11E007_05230 [Escherichia coli]|nr:hypothetical protein EC11E007_05230 [Escherichia coli]